MLRTEVDTTCERHTLARIHADTETFAQSIAVDRNKQAYPDPPLTHITDSTLEKYHKRLEQFRRNYTPKNKHERDEIDSLLDREQMRCNIERGKRHTPSTPAQLDIPDDVAETIEDASFNTGYGHVIVKKRQIDWDAYDTLMNDVALDHLRTYSAYQAVHGQNLVDRHRPSVINAIRLVRGDPTVSLDNIIEFEPFEETKEKIELVNEDGEEVEPERGIPFDTVREELRQIVDNHPTLPVALALANIGRVSNYNQPGLAGSYNSFGANFSSSNNDDEQNVVAHEFFHSVQQVLGIFDSALEGEWADCEKEPHDWKGIVFPSDVHPSIKAIQRDVAEYWNKLRCELCEPLGIYQMKNPNELTAVAFETYIASPATLKEGQPDLYDIIERCVEPL